MRTPAWLGWPPAYKHGNSQAVRLPKEFRFAGSEVQIKRVGAGVLLLPSPSSYEQVMAVLERFAAFRSYRSKTG